MARITHTGICLKKKKRDKIYITLFGVVPPVLCFWSMELNPWKMISAQNGEFDGGMCGYYQQLRKHIKLVCET